jgi:hypothetical protein
MTSMGIVRQPIISPFTGLDPLQLDASARQTRPVADLATLLKLQNALENDHSAIEEALSDVRGGILALRAASESANRGESGLTGFAAEIRFVCSASEAALEAFSQWPDANNERWTEPLDSRRIRNPFIKVFAVWGSTDLPAIIGPNTA